MSTILLLNGASSSGKSTLIQALISELREPYFSYSSDKLVDANILPEVNREHHHLANSWNVIRPKFFEGFHRSIQAFADAGNDLIVEHVIECEEWLSYLVELLQGHNVFYIGVFCPIEILNTRERARGDRFIGEGQSHLDDGIHTWSSYDLEVDTYHSSQKENVENIQELVTNKGTETIFEKLHSRYCTSLP